MLERLANLVVVLTRPKFPENIGSAARAVANMGLGGLRVVAPERAWPEPMERLASSCGLSVLSAMTTHDSLGAALADCVAAAAFTARLGRRRGRLLSPRHQAPQLLALAAQGRVALVFGPEDKGLSTEEVDQCGYTVCIPTSQASSLNLAQAVVVAAYELRQAALETGEAEQPSSPRPASLKEMDGLKDHLTQALVALGTVPADNPRHFFRPFKASLERAGLTSREVRAWRGLARQAIWMAGRAKGQPPEAE